MSKVYCKIDRFIYNVYTESVNSWRWLQVKTHRPCSRSFSCNKKGFCFFLLQLVTTYCEVLWKKIVQIYFLVLHFFFFFFFFSGIVSTTCMESRGIYTFHYFLYRVINSLKFMAELLKNAAMCFLKKKTCLRSKLSVEYTTARLVAAQTLRLYDKALWLLFSCTPAYTKSLD